MAENGILDYQGMNQAIYRGATSNIVVDTQSMSIEIGAGNSSHTSNLHIECDHDANVASIQLNSNVVTEFSRSKKLIKYPRVAMTSDNQPTGYVASASSNYPSASSDPWQAFDNIWDPDGSGTNSWESHSSSFASGTTNVGPRSSTGLNTFDSNNGEYLNIKLPEKIVLQRYEHTTRANRWWEGPYSGFLYGSNDGFTTYEKIHTFSAIDLRSEASYIHTVNATKAYNEYRFHVTQTQASVYVSICLFDLFGVPEYDPEAHGTDVTVKSYPNVPNTDWLEVYYDAKGLENAALSTASGAISGLGGTTNNGTAYGNPQISDGAFVLDGTGDYISTSVNATLTYHTASMWIMFDNPSTWEAVYYLGPASGLSGGNNFAIYVHADNYFRLETSGAYFDVNYQFVPGKWVHMTVVFRGTGLEDCEVYIDNVKLSPRRVSLNPTADLTITGTNNLNIGGRYLTSNGLQYQLEGKIANFRLFNRILTTDEIYQLYAYQKEYFGYGDLSMTLKAGRLGIGTSEPRAMLDVRGNIQFSLIISHRSINSDTHSSAGRADVSNFDGSTNVDASYIPFDTILYENPPGIHNTKVFSCPVKGLYECHADILTNDGSNYDGDHEWVVNGASLSIQRRGWATTGNGSYYVQATSHHYIELNAGDTIGIVNRSNQVWYGSAGNAHSHMSIRLITPT